MPGTYIVGLTGGIGCGKSTVTGFFAGLGVPIIDADILSHQLTQPGEPALDEIKKVFGNDIVSADGALDRKKLKNKVFTDDSLKQKLESILHPKVFNLIKKKLGEINSDYCILSIPLLLETNAEHLVDSVLVIDCPEEIQLQRILERDGLPEDAANSIISNQIKREERLNKADEIIFNNSDLDNLSQQVLKLHEEYSNRAFSDKNS